MLPLLLAGGAAIAGGAISNWINGNPADAQKRQMEEYMRQVQNRGAPQAGQAQQSAMSGFRSNQQDLISRLEAMSKGQGPSLAMEQLRAATDRNNAVQAGMANSGRGGPLAHLTAANNMGRLGAQSAQDSASARIAEQQMALGMLGQNIQAGRGADEDITKFNALQTNFRDQFNVEAQLRARGLDDEAIARIMQQQTMLNSRPTFGDQLMGGGAGLMSLGATMYGNKRK